MHRSPRHTRTAPHAGQVDAHVRPREGGGVKQQETAVAALCPREAVAQQAPARRVEVVNLSVRCDSVARPSPRGPPAAGCVSVPTPVRPGGARPHHALPPPPHQPTQRRRDLSTRRCQPHVGRSAPSPSPSPARAAARRPPPPPRPPPRGPPKSGGRSLRTRDRCRRSRNPLAGGHPPWHLFAQRPEAERRPVTGVWLCGE